MYARVARAINVGLLFAVGVALNTTASMTKAAGAELLVGNTAPYSGPASAYSTIGKGLSAYFDMLNSKGGVGGNTIKFISYDDSHSPPKTVGQVRRLVESDEVEL